MKTPKHLLLVIGTAWLFDAMDVALLSFIMPMLKTEWQLSSTQLGLVGAMTNVGMIFGAVGCGRLADTFGRRRVLMGTLVLFSLSNLALAFAPDVTWFMIIRFVAGISLGGELPVAATVLADHFTGVKQSQMLVLADSFWAWGWIVASLIAYLVMPAFGWRIAVGVTLIASFYAFILREHLPAEAPRTDHARAPFRELLTGRNLATLIPLSALWFIVMLTYYGIFLWLPSVLTMRGFSIVSSLGYTLAMSFAQLPGYYLAAWLMTKISRKKIMALYLTGTILASLVFAAASSTALILIGGAALSFFDLGAWGTLIALTPGQFARRIRGTAMGTAQSVGRVGSTIGPFLVGWLLDAQFGLHGVFGIMIGLLLLALVLLLVFVKDQPVSEDAAAKPARALR
ncbi:MFS transporter [Lacticaseibacillus jixianensis]|uniref:MFS transporter n=1 Tax=Lacticaseibacillus jixianensis TaxID=2486012 RepID=A0ABW4B742_9LACO|nr:MFS transporter [Lacticaseibacillus jixianensis]